MSYNNQLQLPVQLPAVVCPNQLHLVKTKRLNLERRILRLQTPFWKVREVYKEKFQQVCLGGAQEVILYLDSMNFHFISGKLLK
jgi:hypothetical protein